MASNKQKTDKPIKVHPTRKQRAALDKMVENGGNASRAMREVGYSPMTAKSPHKLTESLGFIALCEERGLTDHLLIDALVEDIKEKKGNRARELEIGFKVKRKFLDGSELPNGVTVNIVSFNAGSDSDQ